MQDIVIKKDLLLPLAEDYYALRRLGLEAVEELGSAQWSDYNAHDPGITLLEALAYALSEAGYRVGFDIADILTEKTGVIGFRQALFTARRILTNCALTPNDYRKILVDQRGIRNAWLRCNTCPCELTLFAECRENALFFAPQWRLTPPFEGQQNREHEHPITLRGFYDVWLELDEDPELGDLNDQKIQYNVNYQVAASGQVVPLTVELRFPDAPADEFEVYQRFSNPEAILTGVIVTRFSRDRVLNELVDEDAFVQGWRGVFFADYTLDFKENAAAAEESLVIKAVPVRFFSPKEGVKREVNVADLVNDVLANDSLGGIAGKYQRKRKATRQAVENAQILLHQNRNLAEDFCQVHAIRVQDVAICADIEVAIDADIEWVLANVYHEIELYLNPPIRFYSLTEMENDGYTTDEIFDGPPLDNGFIRDEELEAAALRTELHLSDIINRLMDIPGVIAVKDVQMTLYDASGMPQNFPQPWSVPVPAGHLPRLYEETSRILFYKNGLPFLPRMEEAKAILAQLRGELAQPKIPGGAHDYPVTAGRYSDLAEYYPVQHSLPVTYGVGTAGLPERATAMRKAQARQLKGYLLPFEQIIANWLEQLAHTNELFSTDETLDRTYFGHYFDPGAPAPEIAELADLWTAPAMTAADLQTLLEPRAVYYDRRNRFLDHLLARFGEQFRDYALMLYANSDRVALAPEKLILDKIRFLRFYPRISAARAKAFNYRDADLVCDYRNQSGLTERISRLLGMETIKSAFSVQVVADPNEFVASFEMKNAAGAVLLRNDLPILGATGEDAEDDAWEMVGQVIAHCTNPARYGVTTLQNEDGATIAELEPGVLPADIVAFATPILLKERAFVVEHLLLRPKFPGDALLPVCLSDDCTFCGDEDPYSFRLTFVLQGSLEPFSLDIDLRRFADTTIRKETPAHLLPKICWVGNNGVERDPCAAVIGRISTLLQANDAALTPEMACACANTIYANFDATFQTWFSDKLLDVHPVSVWQFRLESVFTQTAGDFACVTAPSIWPDIRAALVLHFAELAANGFQFDRFERAWCTWLTVNAEFEWPVLNRRLQERTEALLRRYLPATATAQTNYCACAALVTGYFGDRFRAWMTSVVAAGLAPADIPAGALNTEVWTPFTNDLLTIRQFDAAFCLPANLLANAAFLAELQQLLVTTYSEWVEVSWHLHRLLGIFNHLNSIYPAATLHDCDDGADDNPVRLNSTILGSI